MLPPGHAAAFQAARTSNEAAPRNRPTATAPTLGTGTADTIPDAARLRGGTDRQAGLPHTPRDAPQGTLRAPGASGTASGPRPSARLRHLRRAGPLTSVSASLSGRADPPSGFDTASAFRAAQAHVEVFHHGEPRPDRAKHFPAAPGVADHPWLRAVQITQTHPPRTSRPVGLWLFHHCFPSLTR